MSNASDFVIENGVLKKYVGPGGDVVIPEGVTEIGDSAFWNCRTIKNVEIPSGVKSIGKSAFMDCRSLKNVSLPDSVTGIGDEAFWNCHSLTAIALSGNMTEIKEGTFANCRSLKSVSIPEGIKSLGARAFMKCAGLSDVLLPESVEFIGDAAFVDCGKLSVSLPANLKKKPTKGPGAGRPPFSGCECSVRIGKWTSLITNLMRKSSVTEIITDNYALVPGEILLPAAVSMTKKKGWDPASETGKALFAALSKNAGKLSGIAVTNPIWLQLLCANRLIKAKDLDGCLDEAEKQQNTEIKAMLLNYQNELGSKEVEKARAKKEKEKEAYTEALVERTAARSPANGIEGMTFVITGKLKTWPEVWSSRKEVEEYLSYYGAILGSSLSKKTDYLVTNDTESGSAKNEKARMLGVEVITEEEFNQMIGRRFIDAESIAVPSWVKTIAPFAFAYPDWSSWNKSHWYKQLREVSLPEGVESIGEMAFAGAENLETIHLPESLVRIDNNAFAGCLGLKRIIIPAGMKKIDSGAFVFCNNLRDVYFPAEVEDITMIWAFDICPGYVIHAPAGSPVVQYAKENNIPFVEE